MTNDPWAELKRFKARFEKQLKFFNDPSRYAFVIASSQSGKSYSAARKFFRRIIKSQKEKGYKPGRYWIVTNTHDIAKPVKSTLAPLISERSVDWAKQGKEQTFFKTSRAGGSLFMRNGALIEYKSFEQGDALVSAPIDGIWVDEAARCNDPDTWGNLLSRLEQTNGWLIGTSSPTVPDSFYHDVYLRNLDNPDYSWLEWDAYDEANGDPEKLAKIEAYKRMVPKHVFEREKLAKWTLALGAAYDCFNAEQHTVAESAMPMLDGAETIIGVDVGTSHPTAICVVSVLDSVYYVRECVEMEQPSASEIVNMVASKANKYKARRIYYDYGGGGSMFANEWTYSRRNGNDAVNPRLLYRALKEHQPTVSRVWTLMNAGRIKIARESSMPLIRQIPTIVWSEKKGEKETLERFKDDCADAFRYAVATHSIVFRREKLANIMRAA